MKDFNMDFQSSKLNVFVSYATEDEEIAKQINTELRRAFSPAIIRTTIATEIPVGEEWRNLLEEALDNADILIVVATGRLKLSHSFSGSEVGYFRGTRKHRRKMRNFDLDRFIIPIAIFTTIPEPVADTQGIEIEGPLTPLTVETTALKDQETFLGRLEFAAKSNPILKLFMRIGDVIKSSYGLNAPEIADFDQQLADCSKRLHLVIFNELQKRVSTEVFPERKIIVRLSDVTKQIADHDPLSQATIAFYGRSFEIFGFEAPAPGDVPLKIFIASIPRPNIAAAWTESIKSLIIAAKSGDFGENRRVLTSLDQNRFFRLFVARDILYYSGVNEIHIYIVEVKSRDYGDPTTTMLLKAISIGLKYRFMFLEPTSEFSPGAFSVTMLDALKPKVFEMLQELDFLIWSSNEAGLRQPKYLLEIHGSHLSPTDIDDQAALWETKKLKLYNSAYHLLSTEDAGGLSACKSEFVKVLEDFCDATTEMNRQFTTKVLGALEKIIKEGND